MYAITSNGETHYVDNIVYIKLNPNNGCYVMCSESEAEGICAKVPMEMTDETNNTFNTCEDTVFAIKEGGLHGTEKLCKIEPAKIAMDYFNAKQSEELINMLQEVL